VLPQEAKPFGLLRLIGEAHVEQTKRQEPEPSERRAIEKIKRRRANRIARSQRRGYFGLAKAIMDHKDVQ